MSSLVRTAFISLFALLLTLPASAVQPIGSAAWTNYRGGVLSAGPGSSYDKVEPIAGGIRIRVDRCTDRWCKVRTATQSGWIYIDRISFGTKPRAFGINGY